MKKTTSDIAQQYCRPARRILNITFLICLSSSLFAQDSTFTKTEVIYGRKDGMALTMIAAKPNGKTNGKSIVQVISGGYWSSIDGWDEKQVKVFIANGYTVFAVAHGSQPRYTIPDAVADIQRAVRYIKYNAKDYAIDPEKIGITGGSSGANLSLLIGLMDGNGNPRAQDPVDRLPGKVQAVACWAPPTDFLNWRRPNDNALNVVLPPNPYFKAAVDFKRQDSISYQYISITDTTEIARILKNLSPINYVSSDDPPVFIMHGDNDELVPLRQSETLMAKLKQFNIAAELVIVKGGKHNIYYAMPNLNFNQHFVGWFNKYLK